MLLFIWFGSHENVFLLHKTICLFFLILSQELPNPHHDAAGIQLPNHLPALHDETGETGATY